MSTYTQILYQIIFGTKNGEHTLERQNRDELYKYIWGIINNKKCHLYRIGGISNHIHIITDLHQDIALGNFIKDIKLATTEYIKKNQLFPSFNVWQKGYGAFTYSFKEKNRLTEYVKNQESHHTIKTFKEEYMALLAEHEIEFNEKYLL